MASISDRVVEAAGSSALAKLTELAADRSPQVRRQVAANAATPVEVLTTLVKDQDWRTRAVLAARPDLPATSHRRFVDDKAWQVRFALAGNANTDPEVWVAITTAQHQDVRQSLAEQQYVSEAVATDLAHDPSKDVRQSLALQTPHRTVLEQLLIDPHHDVRAAALSNRLTTEADAVNASNDRHLVVRTGAARCWKLPETERRRLTTDRSKLVREAAEGPMRPAGPDQAAAIATTENKMPDLTDRQTLAAWPPTPTKPSTKWFKIFSSFHPSTDEIPDNVVRFWRLGAKIDADEAWTSWWQTSGATTLDVRISAGPYDSVTLERREQTVYARSTSAESWQLIGRADQTATESTDLSDVLAHADLQQLKKLLDEVATSLDLHTPPPMPGLLPR